jgi:hypothetical protein
VSHVVVFRLTDWPGLKSAEMAWDLPAALRAVPCYVYDASARDAVAAAVKAVPELVPPRWIEQRALHRAGLITKDLLKIPEIAAFVYERRSARRYVYGFHASATLAQLEAGWVRGGVDVRPWRSLRKR